MLCAYSSIIEVSKDGIEPLVDYEDESTESGPDQLQSRDYGRYGQNFGKQKMNMSFESDRSIGQD